MAFCTTRPTMAARSYGSFVAKQVVATHHQHFFNFRLDFDIEGTGNSVRERCSWLLSRLCRRVLNPNRTNALGHYPAYELSPAGNGTPFAHVDSRVRQRTSFASHHLWATRYNPRELYAAGDYPTKSSGGDVLPRYSSDESLANADVVLWYTMGLSHAPRIEEWPVMPARVFAWCRTVSLSGTRRWMCGEVLFSQRS